MTNSRWGMQFIICGLVTLTGTDHTLGAANDRKATLNASAAAPTAVAGSAEFRNVAQKDPGPVVVKVEIENLAPGSYQLFVSRKSQPVLESIGAITIPDPNAIPAGLAGPSQKEDSTTHPAEALHTKVQTEMPLGIPGADIGRLIVCDSGGNTLLEAHVPTD